MKQNIPCVRSTAAPDVLMISLLAAAVGEYHLSGSIRLHPNQSQHTALLKLHEPPMNCRLHLWPIYWTVSKHVRAGNMNGSSSEGEQKKIPAHMV